MLFLEELAEVGLFVRPLPGVIGVQGTVQEVQPETSAVNYGKQVRKLLYMIAFAQLIGKLTRRAILQHRQTPSPLTTLPPPFPVLLIPTAQRPHNRAPPRPPIFQPRRG